MFAQLKLFAQKHWKYVQMLAGYRNAQWYMILSWHKLFMTDYSTILIKSRGIKTATDKLKEWITWTIDVDIKTLTILAVKGNT